MPACECQFVETDQNLDIFTDVNNCGCQFIFDVDAKEVGVAFVLVFCSACFLKMDDCHKPSQWIANRNTPSWQGILLECQRDDVMRRNPAKPLAGPDVAVGDCPVALR